VKAVITAGGRVDAAYAGVAGTDIKALAMTNGVTMLDRIIGALRVSGVTHIAVVGGADVLRACAGRIERGVDESESGAQNVLRALHAWPDDDDEPLLYATSDLPYVTGAAVSDFVLRTPRDAVAMAVTEHADFTARFPGAPPFGIELARERIVNGGIFSLPEGSRAKLAAIAIRFFEARKAPWRMAGLVNPLAMLRLATGRLSIAHVEREAKRVLKIPALAVRGCAPELAFDADTLAEYRYACENR